MQNKNHRRTAQEQRFQDECRKYFPSNYVLHHCIGARGRHRKVRLGEFFINILSVEEHAAIHRAGKDRKRIEKDNWFGMINSIHHLSDMLPEDIEYLIGDYHK